MIDELTTASYWDEEWSSSVGRFPMRFKDFYRRPRWFRTLIARLVDEAGTESANILEVGCAPGHLLRCIHELRPQYELAGIDYSPEGIKQARHQLHRSGVEATLHFGDFRTMEPPQRYDVVLSVGLVEHFEDPVDILKHHARFCTPGGCVAVTVPNYAAPIVRKLIQRFDPNALNTHNLRIMTPNALEQAMLAAGLEQVHAGATGSPRLRAGVDRSRWSGRMYRRLALLWNLTAASVLPSRLLWNNVIWATGRVPVANANVSDGTQFERHAA